MDARIKSAHDGGAYGDVDDRNDRLSGDTPMTTLETRNLTIRFGGHVAVDSVSCTFRPGELTAIVGPNGAGKTTYFNLISGQLAAGADYDMLRPWMRHTELIARADAVLERVTLLHRRDVPAAALSHGDQRKL